MAPTLCPSGSLCRGADLYHTCYALSGLSIAQHAVAHGDLGKPPFVFGQRSSNLLERTSPFYNVCCKHLEECRLQLQNIPTFEAPGSKQKGSEGKGPLLYAEWRAKFSRPPVNTEDDTGWMWLCGRITPCLPGCAFVSLYLYAHMYVPLSVCLVTALDLRVIMICRSGVGGPRERS